MESTLPAQYISLLEVCIFNFSRKSLKETFQREDFSKTQRYISEVESLPMTHKSQHREWSLLLSLRSNHTWHSWRNPKWGWEQRLRGYESGRSRFSCKTASPERLTAIYPTMLPYHPLTQKIQRAGWSQRISKNPYMKCDCHALFTFMCLTLKGYK